MRIYTRHARKTVEQAADPIRGEGGGREVKTTEREVHLEFIDPDEPVQNALIESFNGYFRDECLNEHWSLDLRDATEKIEA